MTAAFKEVPHLGLVPTDWKAGKVSDLVGSLDSGVSVNGEDRPASTGEITVLKISAVSYGVFKKNAAKVVIPEDVARVSEPVLKGHLIVSRCNTPDLVGASALVREDCPKTYLPDKLWQLKPRSGVKYSTKWLSHLLQLPTLRHRLSSQATGTSDSMKNITQDDLLALRIPIPSFSEQQEISRILEHWETASLYLENLLKASRKRRQGLMQQLLTGKRRFPGFTKPWRKRTIGDVAEASSVRNNGRLGSESVRAVNKAEGMIPMKEHVMADDLSRYLIVKNHWFAYNPMRINIGSICQWLGQEDALVSPDYVVFRCRDEAIDHRYFNAFRRSDAWSSFMDTAGAGGVRIRIYFDDLAQLPIPLPELDEQRRIADLFDIVDREIELLERLLSAFRTQKKGLMQQLLTGKRRVKVQAA